MTPLREAAQQALKVMESAEVDPHSSDAIYKAIADLRAALAEPVQEPVAWRHRKSDTFTSGNLVSKFDEWTPLYLAPPQRKPLTEEEISKVAAPYYGTMGFRVETFARAIERAHGIGEQQ